MTKPTAHPKPTETDPCPCGSGNAFGTCCGPILAGNSSAPDAERLMRSRYTAHVVHDYPFLHKTYAETKDEPYDVEEYGYEVEWTKLVINGHEPEVRPGVSHVDFSASFTEQGREGVMHEKSEFQQIDGEWIFIKTLREGPAPIVNKAKVGRNDPCTCGSGKKYKKCCGR